MFRSEDEVDDDAEVLESARDLRDACDGWWVGAATTAAAAAASCSLECRRSARRRRELSGLRRRGSRIVTDASRQDRVSYGPFIGVVDFFSRAGLRGVGAGVRWDRPRLRIEFGRLLFSFFHNQQPTTAGCMAPLLQASAEAGPSLNPGNEIPRHWKRVRLKRTSSS